MGNTSPPATMTAWCISRNYPANSASTSTQCRGRFIAAHPRFIGPPPVRFAPIMNFNKIIWIHCRGRFIAAHPRFIGPSPTGIRTDQSAVGVIGANPPITPTARDRPHILTDPIRAAPLRSAWGGFYIPTHPTIPDFNCPVP